MTEERKRGNQVGMPTRIVGRVIADRRRELGLTLEQVEERMPGFHHLNPSSLSKMERGQRRIDVDDLAALSVALDVEPSSFLEGGTKPRVHDEAFQKELEAAMQTAFKAGRDYRIDELKALPDER